MNDIKAGWRLAMGEPGKVGKMLGQELARTTSFILTGKEPPPKDPEPPEKPPTKLFKPGGALFGYWHRKPLYFSPWDCRHKIVLGATGAGKTEWAKQLVINRPGGICYLDNTDGRATEDILRSLSPERLAKTVVLDHSDKRNPLPIGFVGDTVDVFAQDAIVGQWVSFFESNFGLGGQYMTQELLSYACKAVFAVEGSTILDVVRIIRDKGYRSWVLRQLHRHQDVIDWWEAYNHLSDAKQRQISESLLRRTGILFRDRLLRYTLGHPSKGLDYRRWMDESYTVIVRAPETMGRSVVRTIMALHALGFWSAALSRDDIHPSKRTPFVLIADEPQTWLSRNEDVLDDVFSKARKYGYGICCMFQSFKQISKESPALLRVMLDNQPDMIVFRTHKDQIDLDPFSPDNIPEWHFIGQVNGTAPFVAKAPGVLKPIRPDIKDIINAHRRHNYRWREIQDAIDRRDNLCRDSLIPTSNKSSTQSSHRGIDTSLDSYTIIE